MVFVITASIERFYGGRIVMRSRRQGGIRDVGNVDIPRLKKMISVRSHSCYIELRNVIWESLKQGLQNVALPPGDDSLKSSTTRLLSLRVFLVRWEIVGGRASPKFFT